MFSGAGGSGLNSHGRNIAQTSNGCIQRNIADVTAITNVQRENWLTDRIRTIANGTPNDDDGMDRNFYAGMYRFHDNARYNHDDPLIKREPSPDLQRVYGLVNKREANQDNGTSQNFRGIVRNGERRKTAVDPNNHAQGGHFNHYLSAGTSRDGRGTAPKTEELLGDRKQKLYEDVFDDIDHLLADQERERGTSLNGLIARSALDDLNDIFGIDRDAGTSRDVKRKVPIRKLPAEQNDRYYPPFLDPKNGHGSNAAKHFVRTQAAENYFANPYGMNQNAVRKNIPTATVTNIAIQHTNTVPMRAAERERGAMIDPFGGGRRGHSPNVDFLNDAFLDTGHDIGINANYIQPQNGQFKTKPIAGVNVGFFKSAFLDPGRDIGMNAIIHDNVPTHHIAATTTRNVVENFRTNGANIATTSTFVPENTVIKEEPVPQAVPGNIVIKQEQLSPRREKPPATLYSQLRALGDRGGFITNAEEFDCIICMSTTEVGDGVILRSCLHQFCYDCVKSAIVLSDEAEIPCPFGDGTTKCVGIVQDLEIRAILTREEYDKYLIRSLRIAEGTIANTVHCKKVNCDGWCICEDGVNQFACPKCESPNCVSCQVN